MIQLGPGSFLRGLGLLLPSQVGRGAFPGLFCDYDTVATDLVIGLVRKMKV